MDNLPNQRVSRRDTGWITKTLNRDVSHISTPTLRKRQLRLVAEFPLHRVLAHVEPTPLCYNVVGELSLELISNQLNTHILAQPDGP
jgi:hypothetical protein